MSDNRIDSRRKIAELFHIEQNDYIPHTMAQNHVRRNFS